MIKISDIKIPYGEKEENYIKYAARKIHRAPALLKNFKLIKKSIDARKKDNIAYVCTFCSKTKSEHELIEKYKFVSEYKENRYEFPFKNISAESNVVIVGSGPSGLFCALMLARAGFKPTLIERGECADERKNSVDKFRKFGTLNENSNVQFGEGGAGTFSDGKLTCGVNDVRMDFIKREFAAHGAPKSILTNAKAHIGTDYLINTVKSMRDEIELCGGKVLFNTLMTDIKIENGHVSKIMTLDVKSNKKKEIECSILVCAIGHSARDTYKMMLKKGFEMERKPFSVGVRIEHKRDFIDKTQYGKSANNLPLPAADYKLSCHTKDRGAYTFCMCPGGVVIASSSEKNTVVTNGMSDYARCGENSNSALLVSVTPDDIEGEDVLGGMYFQQKLEEKAFEEGGGNYFAPCQSAKDFLNGTDTHEKYKIKPSYLPGVKFTDLNKILPKFVCDTMKEALLCFDKKMKGFASGDAILTGVETRSSSPLRITRDESGQSNIRGVYPIGEGCGYAGGIMSSAADGIKCAEKICAEFAEKNGM